MRKASVQMLTLLIALFAALAQAQSAPYKGVGGKIESFGRVAGTYFAALAFVEVCSQDPKYKKESEDTGRNYLNSNHGTFVELRRKLSMAAAQNGGKDEEQRLDAEIRGLLPYVQQEVKLIARKQVVSSASCTSILANLRSGLMDLKTQRSRDISLLSE